MANQNNNERPIRLKIIQLLEKFKSNSDNKEKKQKSSFSRAWKMLTAFMVLLILYTAYHVVFGLAESLDTTPAGLVEQSYSIVLEGVIFREEEGIKTKNSGDMRPYYYDGERTSVDSAVATVYTKSGNSDANYKIANLEEQLDILKRSNVKGLLSIVDIEDIKNDIDMLYTTMMLATSDGDLLRASRVEKELIIAMNKLAIYRGEVKNYNEEIARIESELDTLYNSFKGDKELIFADKGGYFYHSCDGYEDILTLEALDKLTVDSLTDLTDEVKKIPALKSGYTAKFVHNNVWNIAVVCDNTTVQSLEEGTVYSATFFDVRVRELKLTLESIGNSDEENTVLVFTCSDMPEGFDYTRYQEFRLDISSIEGYRVPREAMQTVKDKETGEKKLGVYVLDESTVRFRRVEVIAESEGYYIVAKLDKSKDNYTEYLDLNDLIILDTKRLYDGKVLKR